MRKTIIASLLAAVLLPTAVQAQNGELRHDRREVREERRDLNRAIRRGEPRHEVREERRELQSAKRESRRDWRDYRRDNREAFRRSAYVGPRGYRYRPVAVGHRFDSNYYGQRYWVTDYSRYHLAAPGANRRWVRYGNDVVLVNIRNGRVLAVNNGFFW
jgi:Ni/Co efflux regulator RcnB